MIPLHAGSATIHDLRNPQPHHIDRGWMWQRLSHMRRFNNDPRALTVLQHLRLCRALALALRKPWPVVQWAWRHDCHEAYIGDIIAPVKAAIRSDALEAIEAGFDIAICRAENISPPTMIERSAVHEIDLMARRIEMDRMDLTPDADLPHAPDWIDIDEMLHRALATGDSNE